MKCWNSAFNAQSSRVIIVLVQVGAVKIYVSAVKALGKKKRVDETQFATKIGRKISLLVYCKMSMGSARLGYITALHSTDPMNAILCKAPSVGSGSPWPLLPELPAPGGHYPTHRNWEGLFWEQGTCALIMHSWALDLNSHERSFQILTSVFFFPGQISPFFDKEIEKILDFFSKFWH
jgi:hypothetical protein